MSKSQLAYRIELELQRVNDAIDIKIIKGLSYKREALRHRLLLSQLRHARQKSERGWFASLGTLFF
jgi:hypothetical protein